MTIISSLIVLALAATTFAQKCPIVVEGRVPAASTPATFDTKASLFDSVNVKGANLTFAELITLPTNLNASLFDAKATQPVSLSLSDKSIFAPSATNIQTGFRRAELIPATNSGTDNSTVGQRVIHFSVMKDDTKPLNASHEYQMVFLESSDFSTNQLAIKTGTISGLATLQNPGSLMTMLNSTAAKGNKTKAEQGIKASAAGNTIVVQGNVNTDLGVIFETEFTGNGVWHNFGVVMDYDKNTTQVLYSTDATALAPVTQPISNVISGQGQHHFGLLKKPTGEGIKDVTKEGFQPSGINEAVIYGGIFIEDGAAACVSTSA